MPVSVDIIVSYYLNIARKYSLKYSFLRLNSGPVYVFPEPRIEIIWVLDLRAIDLKMQTEQCKNLHTKFDINSEIQLAFSGPHAPHTLL